MRTATRNALQECHVHHQGERVMLCKTKRMRTIQTTHMNSLPQGSPGCTMKQRFKLLWMQMVTSSTLTSKRDSSSSTAGQGAIRLLHRPPRGHCTRFRSKTMLTCRQATAAAATPLPNNKRHHEAVGCWPRHPAALYGIRRTKKRRLVAFKEKLQMSEVLTPATTTIILIVRR